MDSERLLQRFLRYVRVDTTAREEAGTYPSSPGQFELGRMLVDELNQIGLADAAQDEHGIVMATLPATTDHTVPTIALNSHFDTSPETTGANVKPQVIHKYAGGDIPLPGDPSKIIRVSDNPELNEALGKTLITTDGTTLLGADDKAGIAVIVEAVQHLAEHPEIAHGPIRVLFTCDEEIGHGVDHVDLAKVNATACYTLDGRGADEIDVETFSADLAVVTVRGINIHPSIAKGRMVNAIRVAGAFLEQLRTWASSPETSDGRQGFVHPYHIDGAVAEVTMRILLRDFETRRLAQLATNLRNSAQAAMQQFPGSEVEIEIRRQYRNLGDGLAKEPRAVKYAQLAHERLGRNPRLTIIRGGTDGSRFTELGLPTPNLSTGQHNPHSPLEWACLDEMLQATEILIELAQVWAANDSEKR